MPETKKIVDSIRVKILSAMKQKGSITPNVRQIKKLTGFHRATIKSSIDFLENSKFINGYRPLLDSKVVGNKLVVWSFLNVDSSDKINFKEFLSALSSEPSLLHCSDVITDKGYNIGVAHLAKSVEEYYLNIQKKFFFNNPKLTDLIKQKTIFYLSDPLYNHKNEIDATIDILEKEVGL
jgi:DNA-binding Lrp family transcriptional regulator